MTYTIVFFVVINCDRGEENVIHNHVLYFVRTVDREEYQSAELVTEQASRCFVLPLRETSTHFAHWSEFVIRGDRDGWLWLWQCSCKP
jgi:hypothetical protein